MPLAPRYLIAILTIVARFDFVTLMQWILEEVTLPNAEFENGVTS